MNILYLNHYAGSPLHGMEYRPYYLAREWVHAGHCVRMLAGSHSHVRARQPDLPALQAAGATRSGHATVQDIDGIAYHWYATPPTRATAWAGCATSGPSCARHGPMPPASLVSSGPM